MEMPSHAAVRANQPDSGPQGLGSARRHRREPTGHKHSICSAAGGCTPHKHAQVQNNDSQDWGRAYILGNCSHWTNSLTETFPTALHPAKPTSLVPYLHRHSINLLRSLKSDANRCWHIKLLPRAWFILNRFNPYFKSKPAFSLKENEKRRTLTSNFFLSSDFPQLAPNDTTRTVSDAHAAAVAARSHGAVPAAPQPRPPSAPLPAARRPEPRTAHGNPRRVLSAGCCCAALAGTAQTARFCVAQLNIFFSASGLLFLPLFKREGKLLSASHALPPSCLVYFTFCGHLSKTRWSTPQPKAEPHCGANQRNSAADPKPAPRCSTPAPHTGTRPLGPGREVATGCGRHGAHLGMLPWRSAHFRGECRRDGAAFWTNQMSAHRNKSPRAQRRRATVPEADTSSTEVFLPTLCPVGVPSAVQRFPLPAPRYRTAPRTPRPRFCLRADGRSGAPRRSRWLTAASGAPEPRARSQLPTARRTYSDATRRAAPRSPRGRTRAAPSRRPPVTSAAARSRRRPTSVAGSGGGSLGPPAPPRPAPARPLAGPPGARAPPCRARRAGGAAGKGARRHFAPSRVRDDARPHRATDLVVPPTRPNPGKGQRWLCPLPQSPHHSCFCRHTLCSYCSACSSWTKFLPQHSPIPVLQAAAATAQAPSGLAFLLLPPWCRSAQLRA